MIITTAMIMVDIIIVGRSSSWRHVKSAALRVHARRVADGLGRINAGILGGDNARLIPTTNGSLRPRRDNRFVWEFCGSARINLGKEEIRCSGWKLFDGIQRVRVPPGKG
jgi:hypothetical protein